MNSGLFQNSTLAKISRISFLGALLFCAFMCLRHFYDVISFTHPNLFVTTGGEEESLFSIWKFTQGQPIYHDPLQIPYSINYYNFAFYLFYGIVAKFFLTYLHLNVVWLPTIRFIVCEDGSKDNTVEVIQETARTLPVVLISENFRKGYSRAVIDGFKASTHPLVSFIDSDGQCDPRDFAALYKEMMEKNCDLVIGYRNPRKDHWIRLLMSALFKQVYRLYFNVGLKDPSCPYLIIKREALLRVLDGNVGILKQGFWWEFFARARARKLSICQVPVTHRVRTAGETVVYRPSKVPGIAWEHLRGLAKLSRELKEF